MKDLLLVIKLWMLAGLVAVIVAINVFTKAEAGAYLDIGISYVDEVGIVQRASIDFSGYTISAEYSATIDVEQYAGMLRFGYLFDNNVGLEYDFVGTPEQHLRRVNMFYRLEF